MTIRRIVHSGARAGRIITPTRAAKERDEGGRNGPLPSGHAQVIALALVVRDGEILMLQRRDGTVTLPSGKVEPGEKHADAAMRELAGETGIRAHGAMLVCTRHVPARNQTLHYFLVDDEASDVPRVMEPDTFHSAGFMPEEDFYRIASPKLVLAVPRLSALEARKAEMRKSRIGNHPADKRLVP